MIYIAFITETVHLTLKVYSDSYALSYLTSLHKKINIFIQKEKPLDRFVYTSSTPIQQNICNDYSFLMNKKKVLQGVSNLPLPKSGLGLFFLKLN